MCKETYAGTLYADTEDGHKIYEKHLKTVQALLSIDPCTKPDKPARDGSDEEAAKIVCRTCDKQQDNLPFTCFGKCAGITYCSTRCRIQDWRAGHKDTCKPK